MFIDFWMTISHVGSNWEILKWRQVTPLCNYEALNWDTFNFTVLESYWKWKGLDLTNLVAMMSSLKEVKPKFWTERPSISHWIHIEVLRFSQLESEKVFMYLTKCLHNVVTSGYVKPSKLWTEKPFNSHSWNHFELGFFKSEKVFVNLTIFLHH